MLENIFLELLFLVMKIPFDKLDLKNFKGFLLLG